MPPPENERAGIGLTRDKAQHHTGCGDLAARGVKLSHVTVRKVIAGREDRRMSRGIDRMREEHIKAQVLREPDQRRRDRAIAEAVAEAFRHAGLLPSHIEPEKPLPDVPLHKRGFGVMDEDEP